MRGDRDRTDETHADEEDTMKKILAWGLWLTITVVIAGAFLYAPLAEGFLGHSSRILFFHVPMAWVSFIAFMHAGVASVLYLSKRQLRHDRAAASAVELGLVFCILATVTGSMWAKTMWGAFWNWDPRQTTIVMTLVFYAAYLALRGAVQDPEREARLSAAYAILGMVVTPFFLFILPRLTFSLHPSPVVNTQGNVEMESRMVQVLIVSGLAFTALYFWMHDLRSRLRALEDRVAYDLDDHTTEASETRTQHGTEIEEARTA